MEPLSVVDAEVGEQVDGLLVADELSDRLFAHAGRDVDRGFDQQPVGLAGSGGCGVE